MLLCIKLNTDVKTALKTVDILTEMGFQSIGGVDEPVCVVFWNDGEFSYERQHEKESSLGKTFIHTSLDSFIEDVKKYSDVKFKEVEMQNEAQNTKLSISELTQLIHQGNVKAGWWTDLKTGESLVSKQGEHPKRNIPEMLCLIHSEVSEAMEGFRKNLMDDKLPHRPMLEVELADAVIRILDMCGGLGLDLEGAIFEKLAYNAQREDHKVENRLKENGKKF